MRWRTRQEAASTTESAIGPSQRGPGWDGRAVTIAEAGPLVSVPHERRSRSSVDEE